MSDITDPTTPSRKKVSDRHFIDADGIVVTDMVNATGGRYVLLGTGDAGVFDLQCGPAGAATTMLAIFGFHTKIGNVANSILNDKNDPGTPQDAVAEINDWLTGLKEGQWREAAKGSGGARIDKDVLAAVIVDLAAKAGKTLQIDKVRDKLEADKSWFATMRQLADVKSEYMSRMGKQPKTLADVLGL